MIQIVDIYKEYRKGELKSAVLSNINIDISEGDYIVVYGPSGSGKTSLLNIIGLLDQPNSGNLIYNDQHISSLSSKQILELRRNKIGYIFSDANLIDELTISENIELPLLYQKIKKRKRVEKVNKQLAEMNLLHRKNAFPENLTMVQQQKVAIARAQIIQPSLVLVDEPTANLNSSDGDEILDLLGKINDCGTTIVLFTHSTRVAQRGRKTLQLFDGHLLLDSTVN